MQVEGFKFLVSCSRFQVSGYKKQEIIHTKLAVNILQPET